MGKRGVKGCGLRKGEGVGFLGRCDVGVGRVVRGLEGGMKGEGFPKRAQNNVVGKQSIP